ncbi:MAG: hypothetical protein II820_01835 [Ruminiclostridium sp.]|nr:hypothetical protein [Ruminiclostridium sp.]
MEKYRDITAELMPEEYENAREGVSYPEFRKYTYFSSTAGRDTNVNVMLPADCGEGETYPVLYALHGFFCDEDQLRWEDMALSRILTNLQLDGKAEKMIVVLPYMFCSREMPVCTGMDLKNCLAYDNFINDLTADLMPFIEESFPVKKDRLNTAITGFSMGGREALFIGFRHPELFGYIGAVCPAPGLVEIKDSPMHPGQIKPEEMRFGENKPEVLLISSSKADTVVTSAPDNYRDILSQNGEPFVSHVMTSTGHDPTSVKPHFYNLFRMIFKQDK